MTEEDMLEAVLRAMRARALERGYQIPAPLERHLALAAMEALMAIEQLLQDQEA